jgi:uncharacterized protein (DUF2236 family)
VLPFTPGHFVERQAKRRIVGSVRALFNDQARGERPVERSGNALFDQHSMIWRVHGDVTSMMIGGITALLLQMLHPAVLAGVWDHSNFRTDMLGRLRRTARFIAMTTYGERHQAAAAIEQVRKVHGWVRGTLQNGEPYNAGDPKLLAWVHVTEATSFLAAWQRFGNRPLTPVQQDRYFAEFASIASALGADPVPQSLEEANQLIAAMRGELVADSRTREVSALLLSQKPANPIALPVQAVTFQAAIDLLPEWARDMHGLNRSGVAQPLVSAGAMGLARTLRWAFAP